MNIACEKCTTRFRVPDVPATLPTVTVQCPACRHVFSAPPAAFAADAPVAAPVDPFGRPASSQAVGPPAGGGWTPAPPAGSRVATQTAMPAASPFSNPFPPAGGAPPAPFGKPLSSPNQALSNPFAPAATSPPVPAAFLQGPGPANPFAPAAGAPAPGGPVNPFGVSRSATLGMPAANPAGAPSRAPWPSQAPGAPLTTLPLAPPVAAAPSFGSPGTGPGSSPFGGAGSWAVPSTGVDLPPAPAAVGAPPSALPDPFARAGAPPPPPAFAMPPAAAAPPPPPRAPTPPPMPEDPLAAFAAPLVDGPPLPPAAPPPAPPAAPSVGLSNALFDGMNVDEDEPEIARMGRTNAPAPSLASPSGGLASAPMPAQVANLFSETNAAPVMSGALPRVPTSPVRPVLAGPSRAARAAKALLGVAALAAGVAAFVVPVGDSTAAQWAMTQVELLAGLAPIQPEHVHATRWTVPGVATPVLVITGEVVNGDKVPLGAVLVRVEFKDRSGAPLRQEETYAGRIPDELDVAALLRRKDPAVELRGLTRRLAARDLAPGARWPFFLPVLNPPEGVGKAEVHITAHRADAPAGTGTGAVENMDLQEGAAAAPAPDAGPGTP